MARRPPAAATQLGDRKLSTQQVDSRRSVARRADIRHSSLYINPAPGTRRAFGVGEFMTGSTRSSDGLDPRRRRLLFRSWHRGTREADLIMGRFADIHIEAFSDAELDQYEHLLDAIETDLLA